MNDNKDLKCSCCQETKPLEKFNKNKAHKRGYSNQCKDCLKATNQKSRAIPENAERRRLSSRNYWIKAKASGKWKEYLDKTKESRKDKRLQRDFGITLETFNSMLLAQNNSCKICLRPASLFQKGLATDHHHIKGHVRGLLCPSCNTAIGSLQDNPAICRLAASYLEEND